MSSIYKIQYTGPESTEYLGRSEISLQVQHIINSTNSSVTDRPLSAAQGFKLNNELVSTSTVLTAGQGLIGGGDITQSVSFAIDPEYDSKLDTALTSSDIIDNLTTDSSTMMLSASMGRVLRETKQNVLVAGRNIKRIHGVSLVGGGNAVVSPAAAAEDLDHNSLLNYTPDRHFVKNDIYQLHSPNGSTVVLYTDNNENVTITGNTIMYSALPVITRATVEDTTEDFVDTHNQATSAIPAGKLSGIRVTNYNGSVNSEFGVDNRGVLYAGDADNTHPVAVVNNSMETNGIIYWNSSLSTFVTDSKLSFFNGDLTVTGNMFASNLDIGNWNYIYWLGDHATIGYLTNYPSAGIAVSTGTAWDSSITAIPSGDLVDTKSEQTFDGIITITSHKQQTDVIIGATPTIDATTSNYKTWVINEEATPTLSLDSGQSITLMIDNRNDAVINWGSIKWLEGAPELNAEPGFNVITFWADTNNIYGLDCGFIPE